MTGNKRKIYSNLSTAPLRWLKAILGRVNANRELQLYTLLNHISQGVCMFDASERLVVCNERFMLMYNLSAEVVKPGCTLRELLDHLQAAGLLRDGPEESCRNILERN